MGMRLIDTVFALFVWLLFSLSDWWRFKLLKESLIKRKKERKRNDISAIFWVFYFYKLICIILSLFRVVF